MNSQKKSTYRVIDKKFITPEAFILKVLPANKKILRFKPGQYVNIYNPKSSNSKEPHAFSIASSPLNKKYLEFCIKIYGAWTATLSLLSKGDELLIEGPFGNFIWEKEDTNSVFLVGGIGISTFMPMFYYIREKKYPTKVTLLYGNRTEETIMYKKEIDVVIKEIDRGSKVVHILSHLPKKNNWKGYKGFITDTIIRREVDLSSNPTFFIIGPSVFIDLMNKNLIKLKVDTKRIKQESL